MFRDAERQLVSAGINPGGYSKEALWTNHQDQEGSWRDLYNWNSSPPAARHGDLTTDEEEHRSRLRRLALAAVVNVLFASGRRGLEALQIGHAAVADSPCDAT